MSADLRGPEAPNAAAAIATARPATRATSWPRATATRATTAPETRSAHVMRVRASNMRRVYGERSAMPSQGPFNPLF